MRFLPLLAVFALACDTAATDTGNGTLDPSNNGNDDCSGTAPTVTEFDVSEGDPVEGEGGEDPQPTVLLTVSFADDDGDAHVVSMDIWYDDTIDGTVDTSGKAKANVAPTAMQDSDGNPEEECAGKEGTLGLRLGVSGGSLEYDTEYDFAVVVYDNAKMASEPAFATGLTPSELPPQ